MCLNITQLPADIIITICIQTSPEDLLSFIQTCRIIHDLGTTNYVWHHIDIDLPLDIDRRLADLSASDIKRSVIFSLKLEENWDRPVPRISRVSQISPHNEALDYDQMQPLGRNWLVTSYYIRDPWRIRLSLWHFDAASNGNAIVGSPCSIALEPREGLHFEAAFQKEQNTAVISVLGSSPYFSSWGINRSIWTVYKLCLHGGRSLDHTFEEPYIMKEYAIEHSGVLGFSQVSGPIAVATLLVRVNEDLSTRSYQILLLNTNTNVILKVDSPELAQFDGIRTDVRICPPYIIISGSYLEKMKVHVREMPRELFDTKIMESYSLAEDKIPVVGWESSIVDYESVKQVYDPEALDFEPICPFSDLKSFTVLVNLCELSDDYSDIVPDGRLGFFRFPIDTSQRNLQFTEFQATYTLAIPPSTTTYPSRLGKTGKRAVWRSVPPVWSADQCEVTIASFPTSCTTLPTMKSLLVPEMRLPFEPKNCRELYFEEASGRLFMALYTSEIYLLEFGQIHTVA